MTKKILAILLCLCMIFAVTYTAFAEDIDELEAQQEALEAQEAEYQAILDAKQADVADQQAQVDALVGKVQTINEEIKISHDKIQKLDNKIEKKQDVIEQKTKEVDVKMNVLKKRIKTIYMAGEVSSLEIILGAKDFSDFLDKCQLVKSVSNHDEELINDVKSQLEAVSQEKEELQSAKGELELEQKNLEVKQEELNDTLEENKEVLATLQEASNEAQQDLQLTEEQLANVSSDIQEYYAALKAKQEAEAAAAAQQGSSGSTISEPTTVDVDIPSDGSWVWPSPGVYYISAPFGEWRGYRSHNGLDIAGGYGTPIVAPHSGTVIATCTECSHNWGKSYSCGCGGGFGNYVWLSVGDGKEVICAHLQSVCVSTGTSVSAGQVIGYMGSTGNSTGAHLHFETRYNGVPYNPQSEF